MCYGNTSVSRIYGLINVLPTVIWEQLFIIISHPPLEDAAAAIIETGAIV